MKKQLQPLTPALYARVSSDRCSDVLTLSVSAQLRGAQGYAMGQRAGLRETLTEYGLDEGVERAASHLDRPHFREMIAGWAASPNAPFEKILVWKFSRFIA